MKLSYPENPKKSLLRFILGMNRSKFNAELNILEPEILAIYPRYNKNCQILPPKAFRFVLDEMGYEPDEINEKINQYYQNKKL